MNWFLLSIIILLLLLLYWLYTKLKAPKNDSDLVHFFQVVVTSLKGRETTPPLGVLTTEKGIASYFEGLYLWIEYDPDDMEETHKTGTEERPLDFGISLRGSQGAMTTGMDGEGFLYLEGVKYRVSNQTVEWRGKTVDTFVMEPCIHTEGDFNYVFKKKTK